MKLLAIAMTAIFLSSMAAVTAASAQNRNGSAGYSGGYRNQNYQAERSYQQQQQSRAFRR
jgi:hypothetical protein